MTYYYNYNIKMDGIINLECEKVKKAMKYAPPPANTPL